MSMSLPEAAAHTRHRPEQNLLYQLVAQHYPAFIAALLVDEVLPGVPIRQWVLSVPSARMTRGPWQGRQTAIPIDRQRMNPSAPTAPVHHSAASV